MIIDGKKIAQGVYERIRTRCGALSRKPTLVIFTSAPNFETRKYLELKQKKAELVGIHVELHELPDTITTEACIAEIENVTQTGDGIIVQLPLPNGLDTERILRSIPSHLDVDALNPDTRALFSPVVGAIREIMRVHDISLSSKQVTIIGSGRLVGLPAYRFFTGIGAHVSVVTKDTLDIAYYTKHADCIVSGAGVPGLIKKEMIQDGVVLFDAGTSEEGGELRGDADPECGEKASIFTPVPGGIGPITIAMLLSNVVDCAEAKGDVV